MRGHTCCVPGCDNHTYRTPGVSFHRFPCDKALRKTWLQKIPRVGNTGKFSKFVPASHRICGEHFVNGRRDLENPIPTIFPSKPSGKVSVSSRKAPVNRLLLEANQRPYPTSLWANQNNMDDSVYSHSANVSEQEPIDQPAMVTDCQNCFATVEEVVRNQPPDVDIDLDLPSEQTLMNSEDTLTQDHTYSCPVPNGLKQIEPGFAGLVQLDMSSPTDVTSLEVPPIVIKPEPSTTSPEESAFIGQLKTEPDTLGPDPENNKLLAKKDQQITILSNRCEAMEKTIKFLQSELVKKNSTIKEKGRQNAKQQRILKTSQDAVNAQQKYKFCIESVAKVPKAMKYYTGFTSYEDFKNVFDILSDDLKDITFWGSAKKTDTEVNPNRFQMSFENGLFMTLCRLRAGLDEMDLAFRFDVSQSTVSRWCKTFIDLLYLRLTPFNVSQFHGTSAKQNLENLLCACEKYN